MNSLRGPNADELPGAFQRGEAQLRQSHRQLRGKALLLRLDAPTVIAAPKMGEKLAVANLDFSLLKALAETVAALPGHIFL